LAALTSGPDQDHHAMPKQSSTNTTTTSLFLNQLLGRREEEELMDQPTTSRKDFTRALYDIQWVNRHLGGIDVLMTELIQMIPANHSGLLTILDLGTGSADIPKAIAQWTRQAPSARSVWVDITAVDLHPVAVDVARQLTQGYPEIRVVQADALNLPYADRSFDIVISSMFMHHLPNDQAVRLLQEMARLCRVGFIVNDLQRHLLAWLGIKALGMLQGKGKVFQNDAPLSVLRGFTRHELQQLKRDADLPDLVIQHHRPYRWILSWKKPFVSYQLYPPTWADYSLN
jgi:ubiquinone/menaquinone biosynthesis C-methylase UbiE